MDDRHFEAIAEADRRAWHVAHAISWCADQATVARLAKPLAFSSIAPRIETTRRQRRSRILGLAGLALAALSGGWALRHRSLRTENLTFTIDGAAPPQSGYVASAKTAQPTLSFSDGTRIQLEPRARARVIDLNAHGATVILEAGRATVQVARRPGSRWQFGAGPFLIAVHGTSFSVGWNPLDARFDIHMHSGAVAVSGASSGGDILLRDTQSLSVTLNDDGAYTADALESDGVAPDHAFNTASGSAPPFTQTPAPSKALAWYERYLKGTATGDFGADIVGRQMVLLERLGHPAEATRLAIDYLVRFPYGTYSHAAEALVRDAQRPAPTRTRRHPQ